MKWSHQKRGSTPSSEERILWSLGEQYLIDGSLEVTLWVTVHGATTHSTAAWREVILTPQMLDDAVVVVTLAECASAVERKDVPSAMQLMDLLDTL